MSSIVATGTLLLLAGLPAWGGSVTEVSPGTVVRWEGEGITRCEMAGEKWTPLEEACWFPVDLLRKEGPLVVERIRDGVRETGTVRVGAYPYREQHIRLKDDKHVKLSKKDLARVQKEAREVAALSRSDVSSGAAVVKGQKLGTVGSTGRASGPHLHFGLRWRGARIDPKVLLSDPRNAPRIDWP